MSGYAYDYTLAPVRPTGWRSVLTKVLAGGAVLAIAVISGAVVAIELIGPAPRASTAVTAPVSLKSSPVAALATAAPRPAAPVAPQSAAPVTVAAAPQAADVDTSAMPDSELTFAKGLFAAPRRPAGRKSGIPGCTDRRRSRARGSGASRCRERRHRQGRGRRESRGCQGRCRQGAPGRIDGQAQAGTRDRGCPEPRRAGRPARCLAHRRLRCVRAVRPAGLPARSDDGIRFLSAPGPARPARRAVRRTVLSRCRRPDPAASGGRRRFDVMRRAVRFPQFN